MKSWRFCGWAFLLSLCALVLVPALAQQPPEDTRIQPIEIRSQAIDAFDPREPARIRFGALAFRGGLVLESPHRDFGGLSALRVMPDGEHFIAVTDKGRWLRGRIVYRDSRPIAIADAVLAPILGADGRPLARRGWYDTESIAEDEGAVYVGIERVNEIVRFDYARDGLRARARPIVRPRGIKALPYNKGLECLAVVPKADVRAGGPPAGTLIAISEGGLDADGNILGFLLRGRGGAFSLKRSDEFDVSDCALTPRGELLVLERRFSWARGVAMRIRSVPLAAVRPGALLDGPPLIFADRGYRIDNMEGLAVHRSHDGALVLTLISDDNFSPLQQTLLLQFTLIGE